MSLERMGLVSRRVRLPFLFGCLILFLFFLPFRSLEIPGVLMGFSSNLSRLFIAIAALAWFMEICAVKGAFDKLHRVHEANPYVALLLAYFVLSTLYYYFNVSLGKTVLFGSEDFFFRSWRGRPIGQLLAFLSYGAIPYYLTAIFAGDNSRRNAMNATIVASILVILYYGYFQQACFYLGLPVTGRDLIEGRVPAFTSHGITVLRFYSLAGEPRDCGGFLMGAVVFYWYYCHGRRTLLSKVNVLLMSVAILLTAATSTYVTAIVAAVACGVDMLLFHRPRVTPRVVKRVLGGLCVIVVVLGFSDIGSIFMSRTVRYYGEIRSSHDDAAGDVAGILTSQSPDLAIFPYLRSIGDVGIPAFLFGSGYGNYLSPVADVLKDQFSFDIVSDAMFTDTRSYGIKLIVECGAIGVGIFLLMILHTLKLSKRVIRCYRTADRDEYHRAVILRYAFIVFGVSGLIHTSFYYFILMGMIVATYSTMKRLHYQGPQ